MSDLPSPLKSLTGSCTGVVDPVPVEPVPVEPVPPVGEVLDPPPPVGEVLDPPPPVGEVLEPPPEVEVGVTSTMIG